ncbi:MAG: SufE family protein [Ardenticatenaceae bacterium]
MSNEQLTDNLQEIIEMFSEATPHERLDLLLDFAESMPDLPKSLTGQAFEQVHECASPVFLRARLENGHVYYDIDVPREAPTVRGFANILREGLNGAPPETILATPSDLYQRMGLNRVLSHQRLRGLGALLAYMKRNAQRLAAAA